MRTILIPTDFDAHAVAGTGVILGNFNDKKIRILFFHAYKLTDSISELLSLRRRTAEYGHIPNAFHDACYQFRADHADRIYTIGIEYFYGSTMAAFRNFLEANEVEAIFYPEDYTFRKISKYSIDPALFLKKSGLPLLEPVAQIINTPIKEGVLNEETILEESDLIDS